MPCRHRYTGRWICASPCDNRDDLCRGFIDEMDCDTPLWVKVVPVVAVLTIVTAVCIVDVRKLRGEGFLKDVQKSALSILPSSGNYTPVDLDRYREVRTHPKFKEALENLVNT